MSSKQRNTWKGRAGTRTARGYGYKWKKLRDDYIRHQPLCELRGEGCTTAAQIVHHVIPITVRPDLSLERSNLQSLCRRCHSRIHGELVPGIVVAVCGAPGAGKTTHIEAARKAPDILFDWDAISAAITGTEDIDQGRGFYWMLHDMRASMVARVRRGSVPRTLWLQIVDFDKACKLADQIICMPTTKAECIHRIEARELGDSSRARVFRRIDRWFDRLSLIHI